MNRKRIAIIGLVILTIFTLIIIFSDNKKQSDGKEPEKGQSSIAGEEKIKQQNPVLYSLPIENSHFKIDYTINNNTIQYEITLYGILNRPEQYNSYLSQNRQYKQEALTYLTNSGVDVSKANIKFSPDNIQ